MTGLRKTALAAITVLVAAASLSNFTESYQALLDWASRHGLHGIWALAWSTPSSRSASGRCSSRWLTPGR
jgi:hypothetical protein